MVAIQIRDVPEAVRQQLAAEAERRGQSLQLFLMDVLAHEAASAKNLSLLEEWEAEPLVPEGRQVDIPTLIRRDRSQRDRHILDVAGFQNVPVQD